MTKREAIELLKKNLIKESASDDTVENIKAKVVDNNTKISDDKENAVASEPEKLPTQKEIEKAVDNEKGPMIDVDKDGVSKNGGECEELMSSEGLEKAKEKQDKAMKDVINVADRTIDENSEVQNELLAKLKEAADREEAYKAKIADINRLCEKALELQKNELAKTHAEEMKSFFEAVVAKGEAMEKELTEAANKNEAAYKTAKKLYESSMKLNKIMLEAVKSAQPEKQMVRYTTPARRMLEAAIK